MPPPEGGVHTVVKAHHPLRPQELRLFVGQRVRVRFRHATSGWWEGTALGSGESGWFPGECVSGDAAAPDGNAAAPSPAAGRGGAYAAPPPPPPAALAATMPPTPASSWPHTHAGAAGGDKPRQGGVGLAIERTDGGAFVVRGLVPGFPAQQSGLIALGDVLCKVDRYKLTTSLKLQDVNTLIRGAAGASVELVFRDAAGKEKTVSLQRAAANGSAQPPASPHAEQASTRAHSLADLHTPQRVYGAPATPARVREPPPRRPGAVATRKKTVATGKSIVSDLRAALTLMRRIADEHAQMASKVARNDTASLGRGTAPGEEDGAVSTAVRIAEEAMEAAESAHLAAAWLQQEIACLRNAADLERGRAHAAVERASDAEARSAHYCDQLARKDDEISELRERCAQLQNLVDMDADARPNGSKSLDTARQSANHGSDALMRQGASSRSLMSNPLDSLQINTGGGTAVDDIARGITGAFSFFNPFGAAMGTHPVALPLVSGRQASQEANCAPVTGRSGPNLPFMLQRTTNDSPFVQGKHRIRNDQAVQPNLGSPITDGCALWELGADVTPAASPSYSVDIESPLGKHGLPKLWQLGNTPRPSPHPSDADSGVASGGGEVRGKQFSDGSDGNSLHSPYTSTSEDEDMESSTVLVHAAMAGTTRSGGAMGINLEALPRDCPTEVGAIAPRGRPSDVHRLEVEHLEPLRDSKGSPNVPGRRPHSVPNLLFSGMPIAAQGEASKAEGVAGGSWGVGGGGIDLESLPRQSSTEAGALAPRGVARDIKALYEPAGLVSLRGCVKALARPLCDELDTARRLCLEVSAALQAELMQEPASLPVEEKRQCVAPQDVSQALEMVGAALEQVAQLSADFQRVEAESLSRLQNLEIESCFKVKEAQHAAVENAATLARTNVELEALKQQKVTWEAEREESTQRSNEAEELIRELNAENQNLSDQLDAEKEASRVAQEAAKASARQVEALILALEVQRRNSAAVRDSAGFRDSAGLLEMTSPSVPRPPPVGDLQHLPPAPFNTQASPEASKTAVSNGVSDVLAPAAATEMRTEMEALLVEHSKTQAALAEQKAECEALMRVLKACRTKHDEHVNELEARHQAASAAATAKLDATLADVAALKLVVRSSVHEREEGMEEEEATLQKLQALKQENDTYCTQVALLSAELGALTSDKMSTETALKHVVLELSHLRQLANDLDADCKMMWSRLAEHAERQGRVQMGLIDVCADLHVLGDTAAQGYANATSGAVQWEACEMERQRLQREVEEADAAAVSLRDQVDVYRGKTRVLQQEVEGAEALKLELEGTRKAVQKLQQEMNQVQSERDTLSQGLLAMDGAKSKQMQRMMDLQGTVSTMKHQMETEKKNVDTMQQSLVAQQHQYAQQLEAAQAREQEAQERAATLTLERDILNHQLQELRNEQSALQEEVDKLRLERRETADYAAALELQFKGLTSAVATAADCVGRDVDRQIGLIEQTLCQTALECTGLAEARLKDARELSQLTETTGKLELTMMHAQKALNSAQERLVWSSETLRVKEGEMLILQQQLSAANIDHQKQMDSLQSECDARVEALEKQLVEARRASVGAASEAVAREHALAPHVQTLEGQLTATQEALKVASTESATYERALRDQKTAMTSLIDSLQKQVEASREQATTRITDYEVEVGALASEVTRVRTQALQKIAVLQETCESRVAQFVGAQQREMKRLKLVVKDTGDELVEARGRIDLLTSERCTLADKLQEHELENKKLSASATQLHKELATLRAEHDATLAQQRVAADVRDASAVELQRVAVDTVMRDMNRKLEQLVARHAAGIDALKGEHSLELEMAKRAHNQALADLAVEHQREMEKLKDECEAVAKQREQQLQQEHADQEQKHSAQRREHQQLLADARQQAAQELDDARQQHQHVLSEISDRLQSEIQKLQNDAQHAQMQIQKLQDDSLLLQKEHAQELHQLHLNQASRLEEVIAERDSSVADMEKDCSRKTSVLQKELEKAIKVQERVNNDLRASQERIICLEQQTVAHSQSAQRLDAELTRERQQSADERKKREKAEVQLSEATARTRSLEVQQDALEKNVERVQQQLANQVVQTERVQQQLASVSEAAASVRVDADAGRKRVRECEMQLEACAKQIEDQRNLTEKAESEAISQKEAAVALQAELALVRANLKGLETELEARCGDIERQQRLAHEMESDAQEQSKAILDCKQELAEAREKVKAEATASQQMQARAEGAELQAREHMQAIEQLRTELLQAEARHVALEEEKSQLEEQADMVRNDCDAANEKVAVLEAELMNAREMASKETEELQSQVRERISESQGQEEEHRQALQRVRDESAAAVLHAETAIEDERAITAHHVQRSAEAEQRAKDLEEQIRLQDAESAEKFSALEQRLGEELEAAAAENAALEKRLKEEIKTRAVLEGGRAAAENDLHEKEEEFAKTCRKLEQEVARLQELIDKRDRVQARIHAIAPDLALEENLRMLDQLNTPALPRNSPTQGSLSLTDSFTASASSDASRPKQEKERRLGLSLSEVGLSSPKPPVPPLDTDIGSTHAVVNPAPSAGACESRVSEDNGGSRMRGGGGGASKDLEVAEYAMALAHMQAVNGQMRLINNTQREQLQDLEKALSQGSEARRTLSESLRQTRNREEAARKRAHELEVQVAGLLAAAGPKESREILSPAQEKKVHGHSTHPTVRDESEPLAALAVTPPGRQGVLRVDSMQRNVRSNIESAQRDPTPELSPATFFRGLAGLSRGEMELDRNGLGRAEARARSARERERAEVGKERELSEVNTISRVQQQQILLAGSVSNWPSQYRLAAALRGQ